MKEQDISLKDKCFDAKAVKLAESYPRNGKNLLISFNYTKIMDTHPSFHVHHVHGTLESDSFVFGIEDGERGINKEHSFIYKSYNPILDVNHLNDWLNDADEITFFGYSLGQTDHSYFDDFFKRQSTDRCKRKRFIFYYFGSKAYDDLYWQLRMLTDKRVAKFKEFNDVIFINILEDDIRPLEDIRRIDY